MGNDPGVSPPLQPAPITCIQPGGGHGYGLARVWGGFCRFLKTIFAGGQARQVEGCPNRAWSARDVFWHRNVCPGDPFNVSQLVFSQGPFKLARPGMPEVAFFYIVLGVLICLCVGLAAEVHGLFWVPAGLFAALLIFILSFFRDPERTIPADPLALVSPADGTITDVGEVAEADFPEGRAFRIGMFLSVFNVHVNRVPRPGTVLGVRYFPGRFLDARAPGCEKLNEQLWIDLGEGFSCRFVRVKQISGKIARRIVCWLRPGETLEKGVRLGMIKFGSRTEVYVPLDAVGEVKVKVGDKVRGGSTILLRMRD
jgi:phosphatidylserine decarboxylase